MFEGRFIYVTAQNVYAIEYNELFLVSYFELAKSFISHLEFLHHLFCEKQPCLENSGGKGSKEPTPMCLPITEMSAWR